MSARFTTFDGAFKKKKAVSLGGRGREVRTQTCIPAFPRANVPTDDARHSSAEYPRRSPPQC